MESFVESVPSYFSHLRLKEWVFFQPTDDEGEKKRKNTSGCFSTLAKMRPQRKNNPSVNSCERANWKVESVPVFHGELGKYLAAGFALLPKFVLKRKQPMCQFMWKIKLKSFIERKCPSFAREVGEILGGWFCTFAKIDIPFPFHHGAAAFCRKCPTFFRLRMKEGNTWGLAAPLPVKTKFLTLFHQILNEQLWWKIYISMDNTGRFFSLVPP